MITANNVTHPVVTSHNSCSSVHTVLTTRGGRLRCQTEGNKVLFGGECAIGKTNYSNIRPNAYPLYSTNGH